MEPNAPSQNTESDLKADSAIFQPAFTESDMKATRQVSNGNGNQKESSFVPHQTDLGKRRPTFKADMNSSQSSSSSAMLDSDSSYFNTAEKSAAQNPLIPLNPLNLEQQPVANKRMSLPSATDLLKFVGLPIVEDEPLNVHEKSVKSDTLQSPERQQTRLESNVNYDSQLNRDTEIFQKPLEQNTEQKSDNAVLQRKDKNNPKAQVQHQNQHIDMAYYGEAGFTNKASLQKMSSLNASIEKEKMMTDRRMSQPAKALDSKMVMHSVASLASSIHAEAQALGPLGSVNDIRTISLFQNLSKQSTSSLAAEMQQANERFDSQESKNEIIDFNAKRASLQVKQHKQRDLVFVQMPTNIKNSQVSKKKRKFSKGNKKQMKNRAQTSVISLRSSQGSSPLKMIRALSQDKRLKESVLTTEPLSVLQEKGQHELEQNRSRPSQVQQKINYERQIGQTHREIKIQRHKKNPSTGMTSQQTTSMIKVQKAASTRDLNDQRQSHVQSKNLQNNLATKVIESRIKKYASQRHVLSPTALKVADKLHQHSQKVKFIGRQAQGRGQNNRVSIHTNESIEGEPSVQTKRGAQFSPNSLDLSTGVFSDLQSGFKTNKTTAQSAFKSPPVKASQGLSSTKASKFKIQSPSAARDIKGRLISPQGAAFGNFTAESYDGQKLQKGLPAISSNHSFIRNQLEQKTIKSSSINVHHANAMMASRAITPSHQALTQTVSPLLAKLQTEQTGARNSKAIEGLPMKQFSHVQDQQLRTSMSRQAHESAKISQSSFWTRHKGRSSVHVLPSKLERGLEESYDTPGCFIISQSKKRKLLKQLQQLQEAKIQQANSEVRKAISGLRSNYKESCQTISPRNKKLANKKLRRAKSKTQKQISCESQARAQQFNTVAKGSFGTIETNSIPETNENSNFQSRTPSKQVVRQSSYLVIQEGAEVQRQNLQTPPSPSECQKLRLNSHTAEEARDLSSSKRQLQSLVRKTKRKLYTRGNGTGFHSGTRSNNHQTSLQHDGSARSVGLRADSSESKGVAFFDTTMDQDKISRGNPRKLFSQEIPISPKHAQRLQQIKKVYSRASSGLNFQQIAQSQGNTLMSPFSPKQQAVLKNLLYEDNQPVSEPENGRYQDLVRLSRHQSAKLFQNIEIDQQPEQSNQELKQDRNFKSPNNQQHNNQHHLNQTRSDAALTTVLQHQQVPQEVKATFDGSCLLNGSTVQQLKNEPQANERLAQQAEESALERINRIYGPKSRMSPAHSPERVSGSPTTQSAKRPNQSRFSQRTSSQKGSESRFRELGSKTNTAQIKNMKSQRIVLDKKTMGNLNRADSSGNFLIRPQDSDKKVRRMLVSHSKKNHPLGQSDKQIFMNQHTRAQEPTTLQRDCIDIQTQQQQSPSQHMTFFNTNFYIQGDSGDKNGLRSNAQQNAQLPSYVGPKPSLVIPQSLIQRPTAPQAENKKVVIADPRSQILTKDSENEDEDDSPRNFIKVFEVECYDGESDETQIKEQNKKAAALKTVGGFRRKNANAARKSVSQAQLMLYKGGKTANNSIASSDNQRIFLAKSIANSKV